MPPQTLLRPTAAAAQPHASSAAAAALARARRAAAAAPRGGGAALGAWRAAPSALEPPRQQPWRAAAPRRAPCRCAAAPTPEALELIKKNLSRRDGPPLPPRRKAAPEPDAAAPPPPRKKRVMPPPDPRTVEFLVERGVGTTAAVSALLSRNDRGATRGSHAHAEAAWAFLHEVLAECAAEVAAEAPAAGAAAPAVAEVEQLPPPPPRKGRRPRKGEGEPFTAAGAVREAPELLYCGIDRLRRGWAFLRAPVSAGGAGLGREDALVALFRFGRWIAHTPSAIASRAVFLEREFGMSDGMRVALHVSALLHFSDETLRTKAAALQAEGLDAPRLLAAAPRLASISAAALRQKAAWLRDVAGLSAEEVNAAPALLAYSLPGRVRPRYFFAARLRALDGRALMTFCYPADDEFLANTLRHTAAATWSPEQYRRHIASKEFNDWADAREAELRRLNASTPGVTPGVTPASN